MKSQFLLDKKITFLNHGSFGACPKPIFEEYQRFQLELENEPVYFIQKKQAAYLKIAKESLAKYIGCNANDFFFTPNPTFAINTIMRSLDLKAGDEIVVAPFNAINKLLNDSSEVKKVDEKELFKAKK